MAAGRKNRVLYITYLGILEPIPKSQVLPYLFELSREAEIYLLSYEKKEFLRADDAGIEVIQDKLRKGGITWKRLRYHKYPLVVSSLWDMLLGVLFSLYIAARYRVRIIHARANLPVAIGVVLKFLLPVKLLYDRRGIMGDDHLEHSGWRDNGLLYRLAVRFEKTAIRVTDAIVVLTDRMNNELHRRFKLGANTLVKTIPCCVQPEFFQCRQNKDIRKELGIPEEALLFIYSGSVGTYNLLAEMFDFFLEVRRVMRRVHFLILTPNKDTVGGFLDIMPEADRQAVSIHFVAQEELSYWISAGDVGLVFRRSSPTAIAASPTKFSTYLACGLPVVATAGIGDLDTIINSRRIGVIIPECEHASYTEAAQRLLALLQDKENLSVRCRQAAHEIFSLRQGADVYAGIYKTLTEAYF